MCDFLFLQIIVFTGIVQEDFFGDGDTLYMGYFRWSAAVKILKSLKICLYLVCYEINMLLKV